MKIDDIGIYAGKAEFEFQPLRRLEVKCEASNALMPAPTIEEANGRLKAMAAKIGANAVVEVEYNSGVSFTSWKSLKATGLAVKRISDEISCGVCAETIKRAALKCRYCGAERSDQTSTVIDAGETNAKTDFLPDQAVLPGYNQEPLRENNNPAIIIGLIIVAVVVLGMIVSAAGNQ